MGEGSRRFVRKLGRGGFAGVRDYVFGSLQIGENHKTASQCNAHLPEGSELAENAGGRLPPILPPLLPGSGP